MSSGTGPDPSISLSPGEIRRLLGATTAAGPDDDALREAAHTFLTTNADVWDTVARWAGEIHDIAAGSEGQPRPI